MGLLWAIRDYVGIADNALDRIDKQNVAGSSSVSRSTHKSHRLKKTLTCSEWLFVVMAVMSNGILRSAQFAAAPRSSRDDAAIMSITRHFTASACLPMLVSATSSIGGLPRPARTSRKYRSSGYFFSKPAEPTTRNA